MSLTHFPNSVKKHVDEAFLQRSKRLATVAQDYKPSGHRSVMYSIRLAVLVGLTSEGVNAELAWQNGLLWLKQLQELQLANGLFSSGDNLESPPDTSFTINDAAEVYEVLMLRCPQGAKPIREGLHGIIERAVPALTVGGVHTPNHRWELAAALASAGRILHDEKAKNRVSEWLREGIDVDANGIYSERSANYAAYVSNPCLLKLEFRDVVHQNLHAILELSRPQNTIELSRQNRVAPAVTETVYSRRQDQNGEGFPLGPFLDQFAQFADNCPKCAAGLRWAALSDEIDYANVMVHLALRPKSTDSVTQAFENNSQLSASNAEMIADACYGQQLFSDIGLWTIRQRDLSAFVYAGSDVPRTGRIASGLACNPTFAAFTLFGVEVRSLRLSRHFFDRGPFRPTLISTQSEGKVTTQESMFARYYQPMDKENINPEGLYDLEYEGRFSASMSFSKRKFDTLTVDTDVTFDWRHVLQSSLQVEIDTRGATCSQSLEIALGSGFTVSGAVVRDGSRYLFSPSEDVSHVEITNPHGEGLRITVNGEVEAAKGFYNPGEEYAFLNGTDALTGDRIYVTWGSPQRITLTFTSLP